MAIYADINAAGDDWIQVTLSGPEASLLREGDIERAINGVSKGDRIRITSEAFHSPAFKQGKTGTITANAVMVVMDNGQPGTLYEGEYEIISQTPLADPDPKP